MRVRFVLPDDQTAFNDDEIASIARIVGGFEDGWHELVAPDPGDSRLDAYYAQNPTHRELLEKSYTSAFAYGRLAARVISVWARLETTDEKPQGTWGLREAIAYLAQPLEVLVENERNDGAFYMAVFDATSPRLAARFKGARPAVRFGQGGGKAEVIKLIESRFGRASEQGDVPPRLFVLLDSDARYPDHTNSESRKLQILCDKYGVRQHLLEKRSIENYVGDSQLHEYASSYPDVEPSVRFLVQLEPAQRDHFPVKSGFPIVDGMPRGVSDEERQLYSGIQWPSEFRPMLKRLMDFILSREPVVTLSDLTDRDAVEEVERLAAKLDEEI